MKQGRNGWRWATILLGVGLVAGTGYYVIAYTDLLAQTPLGALSQTKPSTPALTLPTVTIESADLAELAVSASGNLALVDERSVALGVAGVVETVAVAIGDRVEAGALLVQLDTTDLERALAQAELSVEAAKVALAEVQEPATTAELDQATAALAEAQENLADVQAGPSADEIAAARSSLASAQAAYSELTAGPSAEAVTQLSAALKKAELTLADAQRAYDKIAWQGNAGSSTQAADLQVATIDYESAKAAYAEATAAANTSDLQSAVSKIQSAQVTLEELLNAPTAAEVATAAASVANAEATLADLQRGPTDYALRSARITLEKALIELEAAQRDLAAATVTAPLAGVVISVNAVEGVRSAADAIVATLADPTQLELEISVAETDIPRVATGQAAAITVDALPGKTFAGTVATIAPVNDSNASAVSYPVTVRLTDEDLTSVLPGMNAVATLTSQQTLPPNSWLVPTNALRSQGGDTTVLLVRDNVPTPVSVTPGAVQGEWTTVQSAELQAGDEVVGSLTASTDSQGFFGGPPPGMGGMPGGMSGGGPRN